jgi:hypothetical protein
MDAMLGVKSAASVGVEVSTEPLVVNDGVIAAAEGDGDADALGGGLVDAAEHAAAESAINIVAARPNDPRLLPVPNLKPLSTRSPSTGLHFID